MRLRIGFKLHQEEADLARQIAEAAGMSTDALGKLAIQMYMKSVIARAEEMLAQHRAEAEAAVPASVPATETVSPSIEGDVHGQPSTADTSDIDGTLSPASDPVSSQTP